MNIKIRFRRARLGLRASPRRAVTLMELVIAMAMLTIIFAVVLPQFAVIRNSWDLKQGAAEALQNGRVFIEHINRNLSKTVQITTVSGSSVTNGYIQFVASDGNTYRYDIGESNYVEFGPQPGTRSDLAGPVSLLKFTCYDACDLNTPITNVARIRTVRVDATLTNPGSLGQDKTFTTRVYLRTNPIGCLVHLKLDDSSGSTASDSSGRGHNGTIYGSPTWQTTGSPVGNSGYLKFAGSWQDNQYIDVNYLSAGAFLLPEYTVSMWFRVDGGSGHRDLLSATNASGDHGLLLEFRDNNVLRYIHRHPFGSSGLYLESIYTTTTYNDGLWHHLAAVRVSGSSRLLYVDGVLRGSESYATTAFDAPVKILLGALKLDSDQRWWNGGIDDVRIYNRALSVDEINALYCESGLQGWYKFDEGSGSIATDSSGNQRNGTIYGSPTWQTTGSPVGNSGYLKFDGVYNKYVDISGGAFLLPEYTVSAWFRVDGGSGHRDLLSATDANLYHGLMLEFRDNNVLRYLHRHPFSSAGGPSQESIYTTTTYNDGLWHHLAAVRVSGSSRLLYVDGILRGSESYATTAFDAPITKIILGAIFSPGFPTGGRWWNGGIDDVRIYNRALSATEIVSLFNGLFNGTSDSNCCGDLRP